MHSVDQYRGVLAAELGCSEWSAMDRIQAVRKGLPVAWLQPVARALGWQSASCPSPCKYLLAPVRTPKLVRSGCVPMSRSVSCS